MLVKIGRQVDAIRGQLLSLANRERTKGGNLERHAC